LFVFVDESAEDWFAVYSALLGEVGDVRGWSGWLKAEGSVG
jgi:hypothetical protein